MLTSKLMTNTKRKITSLFNDEKKELIAKLKSEKYSCLIFSLRHPFSINFEINIQNGY